MLVVGVYVLFWCWGLGFILVFRVRAVVRVGGVVRVVGVVRCLDIGV